MYFNINILDDYISSILIGQNFQILILTSKGLAGTYMNLHLIPTETYLS